MSLPSGLQKQALSEHEHPRVFRGNAYVYPVLSRRASGISVGINLNPDKACTFNCVYCQVDRAVARSAKPLPVSLPKLFEELRGVLSGFVPGGALWNQPEFAALPPARKRVADIAFSGDGEPTAFRSFSHAVQGCIEVTESFAPAFADAKVVLITNSSGLSRPDVRRGLAFLDQHHGEVWAKLDAGTAEHFRRINSAAFPFQKAFANILACARRREIVIQSCFMRMNGAGPAAAEIAAYVDCLKDIVARGGRVRLVQVYTLARAPARGGVASLSNAEVDAIAERVRAGAGLQAMAFYGRVP
ncbi:MAG: radical SAM protein [Planctomycetota bacterium]|nr:radical SAM protein [Planctomycetota bacterium]